MSAILNNGTITFGDGTVQTTKTPTVVSAFTNDSNWTTTTATAAIYAAQANSAANFTIDGSGGASVFHFFWYNINGTELGNLAVNCNCNC